MVGPHGRLLQPIRQSDRPRAFRVEVLHQVRIASHLLDIFHNPLLDGSYVVFLGFEVVFVYFLFPETAHRTLEELAFCVWSLPILALKF